MFLINPTEPCLDPPLCVCSTDSFVYYNTIVENVCWCNCERITIGFVHHYGYRIRFNRLSRYNHHEGQWWNLQDFTLIGLPFYKISLAQEIFYIFFIKMIAMHELCWLELKFCWMASRRQVWIQITLAQLPSF